MASSVPSFARETVVLLHGVALHSIFMNRFERALKEAGYDVVNLSLPSRRLPAAELSDAWLPQALAKRGVAEASKVHFVAHSMGGLLVRRHLARARPENLGRVVMIATPNHGSEVDDYLRNSRVMKGLIGVNLGRLGTATDAFWRTLPPAVDYPVGTIAGTRGITPIGRYAKLPKPNDGTVAEASTQVPGESDHVALPYSHTGILFRRATAKQVVAFLRTERFEHPAK